MSSQVQVAEKRGVKTAAASPTFSYAALIVGWLAPGAGHLLVKKWGRGLVLFASIAVMFALGLAMKGKLYTPGSSEILNILGFVGDLGTGLFYFVGRALDLGRDPVQVVTADYGTKFIVVAGLLNFISAVDAHNIALGRKA